MNNKTEESTPTQVNQSFLEFHDILDRSNPTIAKQLLAGISETDPGDPTKPPELAPTLEHRHSADKRRPSGSRQKLATKGNYVLYDPVIAC